MDVLSIRRLWLRGGHDGLAWFSVKFDGMDGRCFITSGEALRLPDLDPEWVREALESLEALHGSEWVRRQLTCEPGLQLHYLDAFEAPPKQALR